MYKVCAGTLGQCRGPEGRPVLPKILPETLLAKSWTNFWWSQGGRFPMRYDRHRAIDLNSTDAVGAYKPHSALLKCWNGSCVPTILVAIYPRSFGERASVSRALSTLLRITSFRQSHIDHHLFTKISSTRTYIGTHRYLKLVRMIF